MITKVQGEFPRLKSVGSITKVHYGWKFIRLRLIDSDNRSNKYDVRKAKSTRGFHVTKVRKVMSLDRNLWVPITKMHTDGSKDKDPDDSGIWAVMDARISTVRARFQCQGPG